MLIIVYPFVFILLFLVCLSFPDDADFGSVFGRAFLKTLVILALLGFFITELLSAFNKISGSAAAVAYFFVLGVLAAVFIFRKKRLSVFKKIIPVYRDTAKEIKIGWWIVFFVILLPILVSALLYPPNNGDSLTYHLTRIEQWIQNKNVEYFPTYNTRQLFGQPLDEYLLLQLRLLSGHDRFLGLVQYAAMLGVTAATVLLAGLFGLGKRGKFMAAVLVLTLPIGIMEASSTQNDYAAAFFFLAFLYFNLRCQCREAKSVSVGADIVFGALSLALGFLTKANLFIFAAPFVVWFGVVYVIKLRWRAFSVFFIYLTVIAAINGAYFFRNFDLTSFVFGDREFTRLMTNSDISLANAYSNVVRNMGTELAYPGKGYNFLLDRGVRKLHEIFGLDMNDPATTPPGTEYKTAAWIHEDYASQPVFIICFLVSSVLFFFSRKRFDKRQWRYAAIFWLCLFTGFIFFSSVFVWQPWQSRLLLPLLAAAVVFSAVSLTTFFREKKAVLIFIFFLLIYTAVPYAWWNSKRSAAFLPDLYFYGYSRNYYYYYAHPDLYQDFIDASAFIKDRGIKDVGLALGWNTLEYPLWNILKKENKNIRIKNVVFPEYLKRTKNYDPDFSPQLIITTTAPADKFFFIEDEIADYLSRQNIVETLDFGYLELRVPAGQ